MKSAGLQRSIGVPIRTKLTYGERWEGPDRGLIWCWEDGRLEAVKLPLLAERAIAGELVELTWKKGSLQYLAMWQGIRGDDLDLDLAGDVRLVCTKTGREHVFKRGAVPDPK